MSQLDDLRAEIAKRRAAATAKVRRLKNNGIDIATTSYDPRRDPGVQKRYTKAQAEKYLKELNAFTDRSNSFVRLTNGFTTREELKKLTDLNRKYNARGQRRYDRVKDTVLPSGETVAQRDAKLEVPRSFQRASGLPNRRLYAPVKLVPANIDSPAALQKLIKQRQKQLAKDFEPKELYKQRQEMSKMIASYGDSQLTKAVRSLSNDQFKMLWNYGPFAADISRGYERHKLLNRGGTAAERDSVVEDAKKDILDAVDWVKTNVPETNQRARKKKK